MCRMDCRGQEWVDRDPAGKAAVVVLARDDSASPKKWMGVAWIATPVFSS